MNVNMNSKLLPAIRLLMSHQKTPLNALASFIPNTNKTNVLCKDNFISNRFLSTTNSTRVKEIVAVTEGNKIVVDGQIVPSPRENNVVTKYFQGENVCPLCALNLNLKHTDVLILSQFVRSDGRLLPRRVTGLCVSQQRKLMFLVTMAKKAGLLANLAPAGSHKDPAKRRGSKKYHRYFDESTIYDSRLRNILRYNPNIGINAVKVEEEK